MLKRLKEFKLPGVEKKVLEYWKTNQVFEETLKRRAKNKKFVFYEGPPTANGQPGIHHVLARAFKDVITRYKTMAGFYVPRKGGWDTHGLPVELEVEKKLGLKSKKEIETYGIEAFNKKCKESVFQYKDDWEKLTERIGFWLDMKDPYITYENSYIESVWWILKEVWKKKLLYQGHKIVPWCPRCGTGLSSHEIAQGYKEVEENSVFIKFRLKKGQNIGKKFKTDGATHILSWTTTPWTLPGNVALAVGNTIEYSVVEIGEGHAKEIFVLATKRLSVLSETHKILGAISGKDLVGLAYEPLFQIKQFLSSKTAYKIYPAGFVTTEDGTGVVHTAVMYGEDDYELGLKTGLPQMHTVDLQGHFTKDVSEFAGMFVKSKNTEEKIIQALEKKKHLLRTELYRHEYPFCWRCDTPLLYYARDSWFVAMSKLRGKLLQENKKIHWVPGSIKNGRFGEWIKEAKDWAISRERYWGTPLPIWKCEKCDSMHMAGSFEEISALQGGAKNRYILARHGEGEQNVKNIINCDPKDREKFSLTLNGRMEVERSAKQLKREKIDLIFSSDFRRARETAEIFASVLEIKKIQFEKKFREVNVGELNHRPLGQYHLLFPTYTDKFLKRPPKGESLRDLAKRTFLALEDLEKKYEGKTILIVSHEYPIWMMEAVMSGWGEEWAGREKIKNGEHFIRTGETRFVSHLKLPRNEWGFADPHRPFIDRVEFPCAKCKGIMKRIPEVLDVWFDSGAMPFAQVHYPFEQKHGAKVPKPTSSIEFPAQYISEAVDQTRGWFYTLLAVSLLIGEGTPFKNVICLGHILDKNGQKMSKSKGNVIDPWVMIEKYGADAVRWYLFTVNPPGEPKKFEEAELQKVLRQFIFLIYNSYVFFKTYAKQPDIPVKVPTSKNVLDKWILARLHETIDSVTENLDAYEAGVAGRTIEALIGDMSRWYIRRSRRRLQKPETKADFEAASETFRYALFTVSQLLAPFMPFVSEALYRSIVGEVKHSFSVHNTDWPKAKKNLIDPKLLKAMEEIRNFASLALAKRAEVGIKIRQPLQTLRIKTLNKEIIINKELLSILKDEVNVKDAYVDNDIRREIELDIRVTPILKEEGIVREFVRALQDLRQDAKLEPRDTIRINVESKTIFAVIQKYEAQIKKEANAKVIEYKRMKRFDVEIETKLDEDPIWISIQKLR